MKSLLFRLGVTLLFIGIPIFSHAEVWGADWKYIGEGGNGTFWWYDTQGVTNQPNRIIQVWVKKVKADEIIDMVKSGAKLTLSELEQMTSEKNYERFLIEIDCVEKTVHLLQKLNYDSKGFLTGGESKLGAKESIPTDSVGERVYNAVCK